jgi:hypothetical protein
MSSSKRYFRVVMGNKEHGLYISSTPSSAARKAVSKLCSDNKKKKVEFNIRETTQGSNKKVYGPYIGYMQKLDKPIELEGRVIKYKPIVKLNKKRRKMKGGVILGQGQEGIVLIPNINSHKGDEVSKLISATPEQASKLIEFEEQLNDKDKTGQYHVKMLGYREITPKNLNSINNLKNKKENNKKKYNYKITYEFGGISIQKFLENLENSENSENSEVKFDKNFCTNILLGIANIFQGLLTFHDFGIHHDDFHPDNIVFKLDNPTSMRIIDWPINIEPIPKHFPPLTESLVTFYNDSVVPLITALKKLIPGKRDKLESLKKDLEYLKSRNTTVKINTDSLKQIPGIITRFVSEFEKK